VKHIPDYLCDYPFNKFVFGGQEIKTHHSNHELRSNIQVKQKAAKKRNREKRQEHREYPVAMNERRLMQEFGIHVIIKV